MTADTYIICKLTKQKSMGAAEKNTEDKRTINIHEDDARSGTTDYSSSCCIQLNNNPVCNLVRVCYPTPFSILLYSIKCYLLHNI